MTSRVARYLAVLTALVCPLAAHAENPNWVPADNADGTSKCTMRPGKTCLFQWTPTANANSSYLDVSGVAVSLRIEPQIAGADTAASADLYACTRKSTDSCTALQWDTDGDGVVDDNTLTATDVMKVGTPAFVGLRYIYVDPATDPASGTAEVSAGAMSTAAGGGN